MFTLFLYFLVVTKSNTLILATSTPQKWSNRAMISHHNDRPHCCRCINLQCRFWCSLQQYRTSRHPLHMFLVGNGCFPFMLEHGGHPHFLSDEHSENNNARYFRLIGLFRYKHIPWQFTNWLTDETMIDRSPRVWYGSISFALLIYWSYTEKNAISPWDGARLGFSMDNWDRSLFRLTLYNSTRNSENPFSTTNIKCSLSQKEIVRQILSDFGLRYFDGAVCVDSLSSNSKSWSAVISNNTNNTALANSSRYGPKIRRITSRFSMMELMNWCRSNVSIFFFVRNDCNAERSCCSLIMNSTLNSCRYTCLT